MEIDYAVIVVVSSSEVHLQLFSAGHFYARIAALYHAIYMPRPEATLRCRANDLTNSDM